MDSDLQWTLTKINAKRETEKLPPEILKSIQKYCESSYEGCKTTVVLYHTTQKNIDKLRKDYEKCLSKTQDSEVEIDAAQVNVTELFNQLERVNTEIERLTNQVTRYESETDTYRKKSSDIMNERDQLLKKLDQKDASLKLLQLEIKELQTKLVVAIFEKCNVIADLAEMVSKEQSLECKTKRMESQNERLNNEIANLSEKLNKNMTELLELRLNKTHSYQLEIDLKQKTEELHIANATICQLKKTNQMLTNQNEENMHKLKEQMNESARLMDHYQKEIDSKIKLAELYKENSDDCEAQVNVLTAAVKELKRSLNETADKCGALETKLKDIEEQHQTDLNAKHELIADLIQNLQMPNDFLQTAADEGANNVLQTSIPSTSVAYRRLNSGITFTEVYTRHYNVPEEFQFKEREYNQLKMATETIIQKLQEITPKFDRQHAEYEKIVAVNEKLTQKVHKHIADKFPIREELQDTSMCEYLERENAKLKSSQIDFANQQIKIKETNISVYRKHIQTLEERKQMSDKAPFERPQYEGGLQMEQQLQEATKCSALCRELEEEQSCFRDDATTFKRTFKSKKLHTELKANAAVCEDETIEEEEKHRTWKKCVCMVTNYLRDSLSNITNRQSQVEELRTQIRQVQASPSNTLITIHAGGHKRSRGVYDDSSDGVRESSVLEKKSPQPKRIRVETFRDVTESALDVYRLPISSPLFQEDVVIVENSEDEDDDGIDKTTAFTCAHNSDNQQIVIVDLVDEAEGTVADIVLTDTENGDGIDEITAVTSAHNSNYQEIVIIDLVDEASIEDKQEEPLAGFSDESEGAVAHIVLTDTENEGNAFDNSTSTSQVIKNENGSNEKYKDDDGDYGNGGGSSEGDMSSEDEISLEEDQEADTFIVPTRIICDQVEQQQKHAKYQQGFEQGLHNRTT